MASNDPPPAYIRTVYDETFHAKSYAQPCIMSTANRPNLLGKLEYHAPETDGSFVICVATGVGVFISQDLLESIPAEHRPALNTTLAGQTIETLTAGPMTSIGTTFFPIIITDAEDNKKQMRIVLYAFVVPKLFMGMFIGQSSGFWGGEMWWSGVLYFDFGEGGRYKVKGM